MIDSKGTTADDIGKMSGSREGDYLETGIALHPETNVSTEYEEIWRDVPITNISGFGLTVILQSLDGKTFIGWFGDVFQILSSSATQQINGPQEFYVRREAWNEERMEWDTVFEYGNEFGKRPKYSPKGLTQDVYFKTLLEVGLNEEEILVCGEQWIIRALARIPIHPI
jgi:hypothetical protein